MNIERRVRCCGECPFMYETHTEVPAAYCTADDELRMDEAVDTDRERQPWCPLNGVSITVVAVTP